MSKGVPDPPTFCRAVLHEYERQWARASGHSVRHPLRLKIERLQELCRAGGTDVEAFQAEIEAAQASDDPGTALLAEELSALWSEVRSGQPLPFGTPGSEAP